ncbi:uncharacterized protein N7484_007445 [Penicillium longicatenatum]|uniref:uncharacterized protein n=1 Tax=Penicillium longicatenatum TaxID=1561947 RepID=UPI00254772DE|nr:uncharacterized protein N7484_007445 [Penicillium longicatenatum]KAJ5639583.1 hypothetical protein N7484_007445 [Penicillium longicatenatum]
MSDGLEYHSINGISDHLIGALSLMIPYQSRSKWIEIENKERQLIARKLHFWTKIEDLNGDLDDFEPLSLAEVLRYNSPSLILITGEDKRTSKAGVMGVYLPASQSSCFKNRHEYIFFTLLPRFCVKRWTGIQRSIFDIIKTDIAGFSVDMISSEQAFETKQPFWIGNPEKDETYIRIDLLQSRASLITKAEYQKSYDDDNDAESTAIPHTSSEMSEILLDAVKTFQIGRIMPGSHSSAMKNEKKDLNQNTDKTEEVIRGEELKNRIYGFGRNSLPQDLQ